MQKQEAEKQFEKHIRENELLIYKIFRIYSYTDADRKDLFQEIVMQLWKAYYTLWKTNETYRQPIKFLEQPVEAALTELD